MPAALAFVRTLDAEGSALFHDRYGAGGQNVRIRTRYLDPDVNAFVGFLTGLTRFNAPMQAGREQFLATTKSLWNWGIDLGILRGRNGAHLWELDLMGALYSSRLAFNPALVGEHRLSRNLTLYHRTDGFLFSDDAVIDADQGIYWMRGWWGVSAGYRVFAAKRMHRSGPRIGVRFLFSSPKIPFIFPSLG